MSLIQRYQAIISNAEISRDGVGPIGHISIEDWLKLDELKGEIAFTLDNSVYKGTNYPVADEEGWQEWWVETNDSAAVARVIHQKDAGGFFVSVEFKDEPYWNHFDPHESSEEQAFAVFRMLPSDAVAQIKTALKSDSALDDDAYLNLTAWLDTGIENSDVGLTR